MKRKEKKEEFTENLRKLLQEHIHLKNFRFFINEMLRWYRKLTSGRIDSSIVILGTGIPEELIMAAGQTPFRILGGSRDSCEWSDDQVPRDTDPVSGSVLGYVRCLQESGEKPEVMYIIPANSDSMRKIAGQLIREGENVLVVDFPPVKTDRASYRKFEKQMIRMTEQAADHIHGRVTPAGMRNAVRTVIKARGCLHEFCLTGPEYDRILSASARILIQNSYYYTDDLETWTYRLRALMDELRRCGEEKSCGSDLPKVLLTGSPVFFPNDKIPRLLTDAGLCVWRQADAQENIQNMIPKIGRDGKSVRKMIQAVSRTWYQADAAGAYIKNEALRRRIRSLVITRQIEGVVYHVLKGQIEPDFELSYYEELMERYRIPVFRLETDYQYQDVEQLRIRMEAFTEMLNQNRFREAI